MITRIQRLAAFLVIGLVSVALIGCGGDQDGDSQTPQTQPQAQPGSPQGQAPGGQQAPQGQQMPGGPGQKKMPDISDAQIEAAGKVYAAVQEIQKKYQTQYGDPRQMDSTKARNLRMKAQKEMKAAVDAEPDINPKTFQLVMMQAQRNPEVRKQFFSAIKEAGGSPPQPQKPQQQPGGQQAPGQR